MHRELHSRKYLHSIRKELRENLTFSEARLWDCLKGKQLEGRKFRRQHSIGNFIVDFYCASENLVIEVDGTSHDSHVAEMADMERDEKLKSLGFRTIRIPAIDIKDNIDGVLFEIAAAFGTLDQLPA